VIALRAEITTASAADAASSTAALFAVRDAVERAVGAPVLREGDDIGFVVDGAVADPEVRRLLVTTCDALADYRMPVLVATPGPLRGAGLELALACDLRFVRDGTTISLPAAADDPLPVGGLQRLVRLGGTALATRMLVLAERPEAGRDASLDRFLTAVESPAARAEEALAALTAAAPLAVEALKVSLAASLELPLSGGLAVEADLASLLLPTADRAEGLAAQREQRPPTFLGG
jgi:enoyl-CoA hydratase/carnithine racemase